MRAPLFYRMMWGGAGMLLVFSGMFMTENRIAFASTETADADSNFDNLEIVDAGLNGKLAVLRVGSERTSTNLLEVFAGLKNKTAHVLKIEVQTIYKDKFGTPLSEGKGSWVPIKLKPHGEMEYRSASISEDVDATNFLIRIRREPAAPEVQ